MMEESYILLIFEERVQVLPYIAVITAITSPFLDFQALWVSDTLNNSHGAMSCIHTSFQLWEEYRLRETFTFFLLTLDLAHFLSH